MKLKIAYLGPRGTFSEEALELLCETVSFGEEDLGSPLMLPMDTIADCLQACQDKEVDYAMVPMENSIEGSVNMTLDWLIHRVDLPIQAELTLAIAQNAMMHAEQSSLPLAEVTTVFSHPQGIAQCHEFIRENCPQAEIEYMKSTAEAAEWVAQNPEQKWLAIAPKKAAQMNSLYIKKASIQDYSNNFTRFVLVGKTSLPLENNQASNSISQEAEQKYKSSILVTLPEDFPGALHQVLAAFSWRRLNLSRIESRPTKKGLGNYFFFIDIEQQLDDVLLPGALSEIEALGCQIRFLGSYPCFLQKVMSKIST